MTANPDPVVTTIPLPVYGPGGKIGTPVLTIELWESTVKATVSSVALALPAGRYLIRTVVNARPGHLHPPPQEVTTDTGVRGAAGNVNNPAGYMRTLRQLDGVTGTLWAAVEVRWWNGAAWVPFATSWQPGPASAGWTIPAAAAAAAGVLDFGSQIHLVIPSSRQTPFTAQPNDPANVGWWFGPRIGLANQLGVKVLRFSAPWSFLQPTAKGTWDSGWSRTLDAYIAQLALNGQKVLLELGSGAPAYAAAGGNASNGPASWADYETWVQAIVNRIGPGNIYAVEGINEPNASSMTGFYAVPANVVTETSHLRTAVKAVSAAIPVIGPAIAYGDTAYLTSLYNAGLAGLTDGICIHPYPVRFTSSGIPASFGPTTPGLSAIFTRPEVAWGDAAGDPYHPVTAAQAIHEVMRAHGEGGNPVYLTEFGAATSLTGPGLTYSTMDVGELEQAKYVTTLMRMLARTPFVKYAGWYTLCDTTGTATDPADGRLYGDTPTNWNSRWGVANWNATARKPAAAALQAAIANSGA